MRVRNKEGKKNKQTERNNANVLVQVRRMLCFQADPFAGWRMCEWLMEQAHKVRRNH